MKYEGSVLKLNFSDQALGWEVTSGKMCEIKYCSLPTFGMTSL